MIQKLKRLCLCVLGAALLFCMGPAASAETSHGDPDWQVVFSDKLETNFNSAELTEVLLGLQPDDNAILSIKLVNRNAQKTDWYMSNDITDLALGGSVSKGGAYSYRLIYRDKSGTDKVLYDSETLGGENGNSTGTELGSDALKDFFYLGTLDTNEQGTVTLEVTLDGETQTNDYQNTLADLQMNFAVELGATDGRGPNGTAPQIVRTGDETDMLPLYAAMGISGAVLLVLAIFTLKKDKRKRGDE